jgi:hypothetical protein
MSRKCALSACMLAAAVLVATDPARVEAKPPSDVPGAEPYLTSTNLGPYSGTEGTWSALPIPADRRLVIEFVSVRTIVPIGELPLVTIGSRTSASWVSVIVPLTLAQSGPNRDDYRGSLTVRLYYDGDGLHGPDFSCGSTGGVSPSYCTVTVSGYLIAK